jgi:hypothetical protein
MAFFSLADVTYTSQFGVLLSLCNHLWECYLLSLFMHVGVMDVSNGTDQ